MDRSTRRLVRERASNRCEYCRLPQEQSPVAKLQIEHITPKKHGGTDDLQNLALACIDCNLHKGSNLTGIDPETGTIVQLYNPRSQKWSDHFAWKSILLTGLTDIGRVTIDVLDINSDPRVQVRLATFRSW